MSKSNYIGKKKAVTKRKMKPYIGSNKEEGKYYFDDDTDETPSYNKKKSLKEEVRNANRSLKKAARQEGKQFIRDVLSGLSTD